MNSLNSILVEGNCVANPEIEYTPKGTAICIFTIASNRQYKVDEEYEKEVSFFKIKTYAKLAETCREFLVKGRGVRVVGRLKQERWRDSDDKACSRIDIIAEHVEIKPLSRKEEDK